MPSSRFATSVGAISALAGSLTAALCAQAPVHRTIAPLAPGFVFHSGVRDTPLWNRGTDGVWNNGEGFGPIGAPASADRGGFLEVEENSAINQFCLRPFPYEQGQFQGVSTGWHSYVWTNAFHPLNYSASQSARTVHRCVAVLRPANLPFRLGITHPESAVRTNFPAKPWVDDAAVEIFAPTTPRSGNQPIALVVVFLPTFDRPGAGGLVLSYPGLNCPDGLLRFPAQGTTTWFTNVSPDGDVVARPSPSPDQIVATWQQSNAMGNYWPVCAYVIPPVPGRQTELCHQRGLQLVDAMRDWLTSATAGPTPKPPGIGAAVNPSDIAVVVAGQSNGGIQSLLAIQRAQGRIHGAFTTLIAPSLSMMYDERELINALQRFSGFGPAPTYSSEFESLESRDWIGFAFNRGRRLRDFSVLRHALGSPASLLRPICMQIGDEDPYSTGSDWVRRLQGNAFQESGAVQNLRWMSAEKRCHDGGLVTKPYATPLLPGAQTYHPDDAILDLIAEAVLGRATPAASVPALPPQANALRDADQATEWVWGRRFLPQATVGALVEDSAFFNQAQPGWLGTHLGHQESILVSGNRVFVGCTEGSVASLEVEAGGVNRLVVVDRARPLDPAQTTVHFPPGTPFGHESFGLAKMGAFFVVGTRRHLFKLNASLDEVARLDLPWEEGRPYRIRTGDVLPSPQGSSLFAGPDIVFVSGNGGLVIVDQNLAGPPAVFREPGIKDIVIPTVTYPGSSGTICMLSQRGVVANLTLSWAAGGVVSGLLRAVSAPFEGGPIDLERQLVGDSEVLLAAFGNSLRGMNPSTLATIWESPFVTAATTLPQGPASNTDLATVMPSGPGSGAGSGDDQVIGEHIVILHGNTLSIFNEYGSPIAWKDLTTYLPCAGATAIAIGELRSISTTSGPYTDEVVVATAGGHCTWFHLNEVATASTSLAAVAQLAVGQHGQPRTNTSLSCTWGIATSSAPILDLLDQGGMHWQLSGGGGCTLGGFSPAAFGTRAWSRVPVVATSAAPSTGIANLPLFGLTVPSAFAPGGQNIFQLQLPPTQPQAVWSLSGCVLSSLGTHYAWRDTGDALVEGATSYLARFATNLLGYADVLDLLTINTPSATIVGRWSSIDIPPPGSTGTANIGFSSVRSSFSGSAYVDAQALRIFRAQNNGVPSGPIRLAIGCPGGRVRVFDPSSTPSQPFGQTLDSSLDMGTGGIALAVRPNGLFTDLFFANFTGHAARGTYLTGTLDDTSLITGSLTWHRYDEATKTLSVIQTLQLQPSATDPRGAFGTVGIAIGDLLPGGGDELVVTSLAGDMLVFALNAASIVPQPAFRTSVPGGLGLYNSMKIVDIDPSAPGAELYVSGSRGIRKWKR
jgi:hypothetical protein